MEKEEIIVQVQNIFRDVLENSSIILTPNTTSADIVEWDSLSHIQLIVEIESHFDVEFTSEEIVAWKNVGDMVNFIFSKKR